MFLDMGFSRPHVELALRKKRRSSTKFDVLLDWLIAHPDPTAAVERQCANQLADLPAPTRKACGVGLDCAVATADPHLQRPSALERRRGPCIRRRARSRELETEEEAQLAWALAESLRMAEEPPMRRRRLRSKTPIRMAGEPPIRRSPGHGCGAEGAADASIVTEPQLCRRRLRSKTPPAHRCGVRHAVGTHPAAVDSTAPVWAGRQRRRHGGSRLPSAGRGAQQKPAALPRVNARWRRLCVRGPEVCQASQDPSPRRRDDGLPRRHWSFWERLSATYAHGEPVRTASQPSPDVSCPAEMSRRCRRSKTPPREEHWSLVEESRVAADAALSRIYCLRAAQEERPALPDIWARLSSTYALCGQSFSRSASCGSCSKSPERATSHLPERGDLEAPGDRRRWLSHSPAPAPRRSDLASGAPAPCGPSSSSDSVVETAHRRGRSRSRRRRHGGPLEKREEPRSGHRQTEEEAPSGCQPSRLAVKPDKSTVKPEESTVAESWTKPWLLPVASHGPWEPSHSRIRRLSAGGA